MAAVTTQELFDWILSNWPGKLNFKQVETLPATMQANVLYIMPSASKAVFYDGQKAVNIGSAEFNFSYPYCFNFFSDLDTTSAEITCKGKKEFEAAFYSSKLSGISFLPKLNLATYPATPITTLVSLNQWIADNVASDTTLWQLKIVATYATNQTGEASATLIEKSSSSSQGQGTGNTSSQVGGTPATSGTGWAQYKDSQYTSVAPFRLTAGIDTVLPNNASDKIETQLPAGVVSLYNAANQKITPAASGDAYSLQVSFRAVPTIAGITLDFAIDIGGAFGKIFKHRVRLGDAGQFEPVNISISALYSLDTFVANGGQIKITASQDVDVHSVGYIITRTHKAK